MIDDVIEVLSHGDIHQQYYNCVVLYKGEPVKVTGIGDAAPYKVNITHLRTQKRSSVLFTLEHFSPPNFRLGMLNTDQGALWMSRKPVRNMQVGLSAKNTMLEALPSVYMNGIHEAIKKANMLCNVELAETIAGEYPDFRTCIEYIREFNTCIAFDRQFAVDSRFTIFYKTRAVGSLPKNCRTVERIQFNKEYEYLQLALGDNCANTFRTAGN